MEKNEKLDKWIKFFALCSAVAFVCGLIDPWAMIACLIFVGVAVTIALFRDRD
jgi:energy-coupling factor transporter transmembrane protein EcfT